MSQRLQNYLRTHRKRSGFSQSEVAFLLGCRSASKVSRYERFARVPNPRTVFAYEVIFRSRSRELFAGIYSQAEAIVRKRARLLGRRLRRLRDSPSATRKVAALRAIASRSEISTTPDHV